MLALASATSGERPATRDDLLGAVSLELMHLASLYHDDVMDEAEIRRNVDSVNARYGNLIAIVSGDYLMARSAGLAADLGAESASLMSHTLAWLTRGQISEVRTSFSLERTEDDYFTAIEGKTATLMSSSCRMGDDILDLIAIDNQLGKPAGQDLAEGVYNLPTLFALTDVSVGDELRGLLGRPLDDGERERARKLVVATDGIDRTIAAAARYLDGADAALQLLPSENLRASFGALITSQLHDLPSY
jgi:heptaprenyl diphosphate synthase